MIDNIRRKNAFTLIELIMTILLVAIIVIPSSLFLIEAVKGAFKSEDMVMALNLARMEIERTNNLPYDYTPPATEYLTTGIFSLPNYRGYNYDLRRSIAYIAGSATTTESAKEIKVEVYPAGRLGNAQQLITTVIVQRARNVN
ncbi:MAG: prepilin-type N-terminal cleavage/methylation domain-containing protein [Candidatus Omnitrophica bacterium]|nr:prepilin-type N-terminal cleavage/methylation domain-containing protein [Candidatus Omnitrophota bacterium]